jgi:hypothetical protein
MDEQPSTHPSKGIAARMPEPTLQGRSNRPVTLAVLREKLHPQRKSQLSA